MQKGWSSDSDFNAERFQSRGCPQPGSLTRPTFDGIFWHYSSVRLNEMLIFVATGWPLGRGAGSWRLRVAPSVRDRKIDQIIAPDACAGCAIISVHGRRCSRSAVMATGKIKWFNDQKGFGFI